MNVRTVRNQKQLREATEYLANHGLPLQVAVMPYSGKRSVDVNAYYWGVVLKRISDETGMHPLELHEFFKTLFNFGYDLTKSGIEIQAKSTAGMDHNQFRDYVEKVRLWAEIDLGIIIETEEEVMLCQEKKINP